MYVCEPLFLPDEDHKLRERIDHQLGVEIDKAAAGHKVRSEKSSSMYFFLKLPNRLSRANQECCRSRFAYHQRLTINFGFAASGRIRGPPDRALPSSGP